MTIFIVIITCDLSDLSDLSDLITAYLYFTSVSYR